MEGGGLSGRMYANMGGGGMLGLEMPLNPPPQNHQHLQKHPQILGFTQQQQQQVEQQQTQLTMKQPNYSTFCNQNTNPPQKSKTQYTNSDEDEPSSANDHENGNSFDGLKRKSGISGNSSSLWHRMKWTDNMVRLLIMAVYYIGDEASGSELGPEKKKPGSGSGSGCGGGGGGGLLQKKGKWKSVSKAMMEKGFYVSPQQCEDKFNDLNKRYKRVNDILGKGTACKVVENQSLLENMDLSPKRKEEVKKLLNSKHLFFREMCAYHNTCGHNTNATGPTAESSAAAVGVTEGQAQHSLQYPHQQQVQQAQQQAQQSCLHSAQQLQQSSMVHNNAHRLVGGLGVEDEHDEDEDDDDDDDEDEDEFDEEEDDHEEGGGGRPAKRARVSTTEGVVAGQRWQQLNGEVVGMLADGSKTSWEKKQWVMTQLVQLEEQGVKFQYKSLELEKQRLKWIKFSGKKEREMERLKIENERKRLENERMVLLLRKKEVELMLVEQQHHLPNPSSVTT